MTKQAAHAVTIQALKANIEAARRQAANSKTRREFTEAKRSQAYWERQMEITVRNREIAG